jgi:hypothetical protein
VKGKSVTSLETDPRDHRHAGDTHPCKNGRIGEHGITTDPWAPGAATMPPISDRCSAIVSREQPQPNVSLPGLGRTVRGE